MNVAFIIFGLFVGGVGLASAGIGIGIPMIPIGIYLVIRGIRAFHHDKKQEEKDVYEKQKIFESTNVGKFLLGVLLIIIGVPISAMIIGIPIIIAGVCLILVAVNIIGQNKT